jgi:hypothetical protein
MTQHDQIPAESGSDNGRKRPFLNSAAGFALGVFLAVAGIVLWAEHRAHILGALPLLLLLAACLGMHFFMHRGHGGHRGGRNDR